MEAIKSRKLELCLLLAQLSLLLFAPQVLAQNRSTLSGYVRDASTGEVLIGANVFVKERASGTATNAFGFYSLPIPSGAYTVTFSYLGYDSQTIDIELEKDQAVDISLEATTGTFDEVEVTADRDDGAVESIQMSVASLNIERIKSLPAVLGETDLIRSLQLLPGVTAATEGTTSFNVRGGSGDQNLIMIDDSPVYNAAHVLGFFSVFNADALKDVKLYKGGIPAQHGGRISSVLDIRQRDGNMKGYSLSGGIGLLSTRLLAEGPIVRDRGSFMIAGRRSYADLFFPLVSDFQNSAAYFYDLNVKANYTISDRDRLYLSGYLSRDRIDVDGTFGMDWGNTTFAARWNHLFGARLFSNFVLSGSNYQYSFLMSPGEVSAYDLVARIRNYNLRADFSYYLNDRASIDFGVNANTYRFKPGEIEPREGSPLVPSSLDDKHAAEPAGYVSYRQDVGRNLTVEMGLRVSGFVRTGPQTIVEYADDEPARYNDALGRYENGIVVDSVAYSGSETIEQFFGIEPRLSVRYGLSDRRSIKASYNRMRQHIHLVSNTTTPLPVDTWIPSGPFVDPTIGDQVALGYYENFGSSVFETSFEVYYKTWKNQLDYVDGAELLANNNIETELLAGSGRAYGLELLLQKTSGRLNGWLSYTLSRSELRVPRVGADPGINGGAYYPTNYDKPHVVSLSMAYRLTQNWSFTANFEAATGRPITYPVSRYNFNGVSVAHYEDRNQARLPASHRMDVSATKHEFLGGDLILGVYNVYNRQNAASISFQPSEGNPAVSDAVRLSFYGAVPYFTYSFKIQ